MHGAGNDYVYLDCFDEPLPANLSELARRLSDRHFGIGADGLVVILPTASADAEMRMLNADGSEAEMCGNAVRCLAWFLRSRGLSDTDRMTILTGRGPLQAELISRDETSGVVRVEMGEPILEPAVIPTTLDPAIDAGVLIDGQTHRVTCVSMGNPHCVLLSDSTDRAPVGALGRKLEVHPAFPKRTNVGFMQVLKRDHIRLRVWERGTGETLACGTGACAAVVAGVLNNWCDRNVQVDLPGGTLQIEWPKGDSVLMTGPVVEAFRGDWLN